MPPGAFEGVVVRPPEVEGEDEGADAGVDVDVNVDVGGTHGAGRAEEGAGSGAGKLGNGGLKGRAGDPGSPGASPGSPSATLRHKGPTLVEAYALWLGQSGAAADTALSAVSGLSYLLLGKEGEADGGWSREVLGEVLGVAVRMVQLFHGFARSLGSTPTELLALRRSRGGAPPSFARDVLGGKRGRAPWLLAIALARETSVLAEIAGEAMGDSMLACQRVELVKFLVRLGLFACGGARGVTDHDEEPFGQREASSARGGAKAVGNTPRERRLAALRRFRERRGIADDTGVSASNGFVLIEPARRPPPPPLVLTLAAGELLYMVTPLLYVTALRRWGRRSWRPYLMSLSLDLCARNLTRIGREEARATRAEHLALQASLTRGLSPLLDGPEHVAAAAAAVTEADAEEETADAEFTARDRRMAYYLLRSPFFDAVTRPAADRVKHILSYIPLIGGLSASCVDLFVDLQDRYFYTAAI